MRDTQVDGSLSQRWQYGRSSNLKNLGADATITCYFVTWNEQKQFRDSFYSYTQDHKYMFNLINGTWALSQMCALDRNQILWIMNKEGISQFSCTGFVRDDIAAINQLFNTRLRFIIVT